MVKKNFACIACGKKNLSRNEMREDVSYRAIVDKLIKVPEKADTRDTAAVKRIATIRKQLALLDAEYAGKDIPKFEVI